MGKVLVIAEAGVNHNGDISIAKKLIDAAKDAGADVVKFQTVKLENFITGDAVMADYQKKNIGKTMSQREMLESLQLTFEEFRELHGYYTTRKLNPLKKMQSLMAIAAKLLRVFYAMLTKGVDYDPQKMISDIKRPAAYFQVS